MPTTIPEGFAAPDRKPTLAVGDRVFVSRHDDIPPSLYAYAGEAPGILDPHLYGRITALPDHEQGHGDEFIVRMDSGDIVHVLEEDIEQVSIYHGSDLTLWAIVLAAAVVLLLAVLA